jgi:hypothetical protein
MNRRNFGAKNFGARHQSPKKFNLKPIKGIEIFVGKFTVRTGTPPLIQVEKENVGAKLWRQKTLKTL